MDQENCCKTKSCESPQEIFPSFSFIELIAGASYKDR